MKNNQKKAKTQKPKAPKTTYIVRWNGAVVGTTRASAGVRYTRAVVGQIDEKPAREWAYATPQQDEQYRQAFDHYTDEVAEDPNIESKKSATPERVFQSHEFARARVADGFDAFVEQWQQRRVEWFDRMREAGCFEPQVLKWLIPGETKKEPRVGLSVYPHQRKALWAIPMDYVTPYLWENAHFDYDWTKVVPVETETTIPVAQRFAKMPKKSQRELLGLVCDKMIDRHSWDEIAVLLTTYLEGDAPLILKLLGGQR